MLHVRLFTRLYRERERPSAPAELESCLCPDWRSAVAYLRELRIVYRINRPLRTRGEPFEIHIAGWPSAKISVWVQLERASASPREWTDQCATQVANLSSDR